MGHKFKFDLEEPANAAQQRHGHCEVYGCPRKASIYTPTANCRYHHGKSGSSLAHITMMLRNHSTDFDWWEYVLAATPVDFLVGDIAKKAPDNLRVFPNEDFKTYKARIKRHVEILLIPKSRLQEVLQ